MNNRRLWILVLSFGLHVVAGAEECGVKDAVNLYKQAECMTTSLGKSERAQKLLEQRLPPYQAEISDMAKTNPELKPMSSIALGAQKALEGIKTSSTDAVKLKKEIADFTLNSEAEIKRPDAATLVKEAHGFAASIKALQDAHTKAEEKLAELVLQLGTLHDLEAQKQKLDDIRAAAKIVAEAKEKLDDASKKVIAAANKLPELESPDGAERALAQRAAELYNSNEAVITTANLALDNLQAKPSSAPAEVVAATKEQAERLRFLEFLESHPLLGSELSGSGLQISSTAGDGKVTLKPEFLWGRRARYWIAGSVSAPINKGSDDGMSAVRNNALLDKLAGDTTVKLEGTHLNPFENGKSFWLVGGSAELGYQEFSYLDPDKSFADPADPKKVEDHDTSYKLTMYSGFSPTDFNDLFLLRYSRQYSHKGQSSVAICPPAVSGTPYVVCPAGAMGAPEGKKFNIVSAEWRHRFKSFAVSGTLSYDRTSKVRAFALPVYVSLANHTTGVFGTAMPSLSAGLQFGWRSDTKASIGVFAGVPFSMVKSD